MTSSEHLIGLGRRKDIKPKTTNKMETNENKLGKLACKLNARLQKSGKSEQWEIDSDTFSNSVGTWFLGSLGGVADAQTMRMETTRLIGLK